MLDKIFYQNLKVIINLFFKSNYYQNLISKFKSNISLIILIILDKIFYQLLNINLFFKSNYYKNLIIKFK